MRALVALSRQTFAVAVLAATVLAGPALAGPVALREAPVDEDGRVTLGEIFEGAGSASGVIVATRTGPSVVLEAGALQAHARQAGLVWSNPRGLRRVIVRAGSSATAPTVSPAAAVRPGATVEVLTYARSLAAGEMVGPQDVIWSTVQAHQSDGAGPQDADMVIGLSARRPLRAGAPVSARDLASPQVIARNDIVQVAFVADGVTLTVTGRAARDASRGEAVAVINLQSGRTIDAVAVGPGRAVAGPAALQARSAPSQFAAR